MDGSPKPRSVRDPPSKALGWTWALVIEWGIAHEIQINLQTKVHEFNKKLSEVIIKGITLFENKKMGFNEAFILMDNKFDSANGQEKIYW